MWEYQFDEDHFYDLRDLPVGGWEGARVRSHLDGAWFKFTLPNRSQPVNHWQPVNYKKKYVPPKSPQSKGFVCGPERRPRPDEPDFVLTPAVLADMNEEDRIRRPPVIIADPPTSRTRPVTRGLTLRERALSRAAPPKRAQTATRTLRRPVEMVVFENDELPDPGVNVARAVGTDPYRPPFRVSQTTLRKEFRAAMKNERRSRTRSSRPATTGTRVPYITSLYGGY